jgi:ABC-type branched-subunit amino acid transport system substrate-binding protein
LGTEASNLTVFKQIKELGGWGNITCVSMSPTSSGTAAKQPGAEGTYHWVFWVPGTPYPASQKFEQDFKKTNGAPPGPNQMFFYLCVWTAINAIELAGTTDLQEIASAARSGKLQWDSPAGPFVVLTDGENNIKGLMVQVGKGGTLVPVQSQE